MSVGIEKVRIKMGSQVVELSLKEAQDLKRLLNETFPDASISPIIIKEKEYVPYPYQPPIRWHEPVVTTGFWSVECKDDVATCSLSA